MSPLTESFQDCADVARRGQLVLNGALLTWGVTGHIVKDIASFRDALRRGLRQWFDQCDMDDQALEKVVYWVSKSLSANYVLAEFLNNLRHLLNMREDEFLLLATENEDTCAVVEYVVDFVPGCKRVRVGFRWPWTGNIVEVTSEGCKIVRGTLKNIQTEFDCTKAHDYHPVYRLRLKLKTPLSIFHRSSTHMLHVATPLGEPSSPDVLDCPPQSLDGHSSLGSCSGCVLPCPHGSPDVSDCPPPSLDGQSLLGSCLLAKSRMFQGRGWQCLRNHRVS